MRLKGADISFDEIGVNARDDHAENQAVDSGRAAQQESEIRFDYLPGRGPDQEGWELVMDQGPNRPVFSIAADAPIATKCLSVQGFGYRLDYVRQPSESPCETVQFAARLWDVELSVVYAYVQMASRDGGVEKNGWIAHKLGPMHSVARLDAGEWTLTTPGTPLAATKWRSFRWVLSEEVERTFGTDGGWMYKRLMRLRLRGPISITPIRLLE